MIVLDLSILNQKGTPMFNSDLTANRPAAGIVGRIFIATDSPFGIFRDTGTGWNQVSSAGGATIYTADGTLTGTRTISSGGFELVFNPQTTFFSSLIPSTNASSFSVLGSNTLTYAAGFSSSNIGNVYSANGAINAQIFSGNATFAQANLASAMVNVNKIDFSSGGHTINMTQSTGIRAMTGVQNQIQFTGSHNGTISHAAVSQNLGFFRDTVSTRTLTITNAYSHLINALDDYGAGFSFINRWGIYQAGATDTNYFAANSLFGTTTNAGFRVDINGTARVSGDTTILGTLTATSSQSSGALVLNQTSVGFTAQTINRVNTTNAIGIVSFSDLKTGTNSRSFSLGIGRSGDPQWTNGDFIFGYYPGSVGWEQSGKIFNATGNWFIGTGSGTTDAGYKFDINGTARITGALKLFSGGTAPTLNYPLNAYVASGGIASFEYATNGFIQFLRAGASAAIIRSSFAETYDLVINAGNSGTFLGMCLRPDGIGVKIGGDPTTITHINSAQLNIESTTRGFLPPRMTTTQKNAIITPVAGLVIYDTTLNKLCVYTTAWQTITSA
jgi:hypothetical protein